MLCQILAQCHYVTAVNIGSISVPQYTTNMVKTILSQYVMSDIGAMSLCDSCQYCSNIHLLICNQYVENNIVPIFWVRYVMCLWHLSILAQYWLLNIWPILAKQYMFKHRSMSLSTWLPMLAEFDQNWQNKIGSIGKYYVKSMITILGKTYCVYVLL